MVQDQADSGFYRPCTPNQETSKCNSKMLKNCELFIETLPIATLIILEIFNHAAISGKVVQHNLVAKCCQQNRELSTKYQLHYCTLNRCNSLPPVGGKLAWNGISTMQLGALSKFKRGVIYCNGLFQTLTIQVDLRFDHNFPENSWNT